MTLDQVRSHSLHMAALYAMLAHDMAGKKHDIDAHNLCSAVIEHDRKVLSVLFSYSNPSALSKKLLQDYQFIIGDVPKKLIDRGGMQDLHTEVRLINHLYANGGLNTNYVVSFFSSRSVCNTCRPAIMRTMELLSGRMAFMAYEFKAEQHGTITEHVYPIARNFGGSQTAINYEQGGGPEPMDTSD